MTTFFHKVYNIPKLFGLEQGGDLRCFIMDNHRPFHLANIHSRHNVVVFDDFVDGDGYGDEFPSDGSMLSSGLDDDTDGDDDNDDDEDDPEEKVGKNNIPFLLQSFGCNYYFLNRMHPHFSASHLL